MLTPVNIPADTRNAMNKVISSNINGFLFRRVKSVKHGNLLGATYHTGDGLSNSVRVVSLEENARAQWTSAQIEHNLEFVHEEFEALTETRSLRGNDPYNGRVITCKSADRAEMNPRSFELKKNSNMCGTVAPRVGDLVCMFVDQPTNSRGGLCASKWFICSEQFLRAWTLVTYPTHPSYKGKTEERLREWVLSGNRLATNSARKNALAYSQNGEFPDREEAEKRFFRLRVETCAKGWTHVYCAMVLMARYGEIPSGGNIPTNLGAGPSMHWWDLPEGWVESFLATWAPGYTPEKLGAGIAATTDCVVAVVAEEVAPPTPLQTIEVIIVSPTLHSVPITRIPETIAPAVGVAVPEVQEVVVPAQPKVPAVVAAVTLDSDTWAWMALEELGSWNYGDNWADGVEEDERVKKAQNERVSRNERRMVARNSRKGRGCMANLIVAM